MRMVKVSVQTMSPLKHVRYHSLVQFLELWNCTEKSERMCDSIWNFHRIKISRRPRTSTFVIFHVVRSVIAEHFFKSLHFYRNPRSFNDHSPSYFYL
jgi:hypothetical protein